MDNKDEQLKNALEYADRGYSVIPVQHNKKPFIKWQKYQDEKAAPDQIKKWWGKWPDANIGIVTGKISNLTILDPDTKTGIDALNDLIPENLITPVANTPNGGQHYYFQHVPGLPNKARILTDCDCRNDGGYVVAVPGENGTGKKYTWIEGLSLFDVEPAEMPEKLLSVLRACNADSSPHIKKVENKFLIGEGDLSTDIKRHQTTSMTSFSFDKGQRDEHLFHTANCLIKGGMQGHNAMKILQMLASTWGEENEEKWLSDKISSALKRTENRKKSLTAEVRDLVVTSSGIITTSFVYQVTSMTSRGEKKQVCTALRRLEKEGLIAKTGRIAGEYRHVEKDCEIMDFQNADSEILDIKLPFCLEDLVEIMPGNVIIIAGAPDAGKTALLLNIIHNNMDKFNIHYFNSEMGAGELKKRLSNFDYTSLDKWNFTPYERSSDFADVIKQGEGQINIIDFLEIYDNFYEISQRVYEIWKKLNGAVAIIALQKNPGLDVGLGGYRGMEKPRLYLSMDTGVIKIQKAKNWKTAKNPNKLQYKFNIVGGCKFIQKGRLGWHKPVIIETK